MHDELVYPFRLDMPVKQRILEQIAAREARFRFVRHNSKSKGFFPKLTENHYKYDDEDNSAKRNIHNTLSFLMMAHPSPFTDYQA